MMQASPPRLLRRERSAGLSFPTLPDEHNLSDWLDHSSVSESVSQHSMASHTDESSVDGNLSSVGESTWDLVDEASMISEEASYGPTQASRPTDEGIESVHLTNESFSRSGEVLSTPSETSDQDDLLSRSVQFKELETSQATPRAAGPHEASSISQVMGASQSQDYRGNIKVDKVLSVNEATGTTSAYAEACTFDEREATRAVSHHPYSKGVVPRSGRLHMGLKDGGLDVKDTFKLLYFGPKEMKSAITQKIGLALAANPRRLSTSDGPGSARVTVVPVSSYVDEGSPEVVMIESGGFDMVIEECIGTRSSRNGTDITLELESGSTLKNFEDSTSSSNERHTDVRNRMPDLSIVYFPEGSSPSFFDVPSDFRTNSLLTQLFLANQGLPFYVITDVDWLDNPKFYHVVKNDLCPHRTIEALVDGRERTWKRVPIDINTFLALDPTQLHQNLVAMKAAHLEDLRAQRQFMQSWTRWTQSVRKNVAHSTGDIIARIGRLSPAAWVSIGLVLFALILGSFFNPIGNPDSLTHLEPAPINTSPDPVETFSIPKLGMGKGQSGLQAVPTAKALGDLFATEPARAPPSVRARKKSKHGKPSVVKEPEPQRSILVRVVGESHILIRSSKPKSGQDKLNFESKRKGKELEHNLQKIDNEYYVLEIPPADAYGLIEIRIWTTIKPAYNETFEIDLGFPWLKLKGWKEMAEEAMEKTATEAQALQDQLWSTLQYGSTKFESFKENESVTQTMDKLTASMHELEHAARSGSSKVLRRSLRKAILLRKRLSRTMRRLQHSSARQSTAAREQQKRLNKELTELYRLMGNTIASQRRQLEKALASLQERVDAQFLSTAREKQLRQVQKSLLRAWWKVGGKPKEEKSKTRR